MNYNKLEIEYIKALQDNEKLEMENRSLKKILKTKFKDIDIWQYCSLNYEIKQLKDRKNKLGKEIEVLNQEAENKESKAEEYIRVLLNEIETLKSEKKSKKKKRKSQINTKEYEQFRKSILKRDNYRCVECGNTHRLQVHHIKPKSKYPELLMVPSNCVTLCISCHSKTTSFFDGRLKTKTL